VDPGRGEHVFVAARVHHPVVAFEFAFELTEGPPRVADEDARAEQQRLQILWIGIDVDHHHPARDRRELRMVLGRHAVAQHAQADRALEPHRTAEPEHRVGGAQLGPVGQAGLDRGAGAPVEHHPEGTAVVVLDQIDHGAPEDRLMQIGAGQQQRATGHRCARRTRILIVLHPAIMAPTPPSAPPRASRGGGIGSATMAHRGARPRSLLASSGALRTSVRADTGRLLTVKLLGMAGEGAFQAGMGALVLFSPERATTPGEIALGFAVLLLPYSVLGPFAGALLDRWDRRRVLTGANLARAAIALAATAALATAAPTAVLLVLAL